MFSSSSFAALPLCVFGTSIRLASALEQFLQLKAEKTSVVKGKPLVEFCCGSQQNKYKQRIVGLSFVFGLFLPFLHGGVQGNTLKYGCTQQRMAHSQGEREEQVAASPECPRQGPLMKSTP